MERKNEGKEKGRKEIQLSIRVLLLLNVLQYWSKIKKILLTYRMEERKGSTVYFIIIIIISQIIHEI